MTSTTALFLVEDDALIRELLVNIRELMAGPAMATLGHNDENEAEKQFVVRARGSARRSPRPSRRGRSKSLVTIDRGEDGPLMPDQDYKWVSDEAWRTRNDALFARP